MPCLRTARKVNLCKSAFKSQGGSQLPENFLLEQVQFAAVILTGGLPTHNCTSSARLPDRLPLQSVSPLLRGMKECITAGGCCKPVPVLLHAAF